MCEMRPVEHSRNNKEVLVSEKAVFIFCQNYEKYFCQFTDNING
jgi:hypothetical protein